MITAFQPDAFQNDAFQIDIGLAWIDDERRRLRNTIKPKQLDKIFAALNRQQKLFQQMADAIEKMPQRVADELRKE